MLKKIIISRECNTVFKRFFILIITSMLLLAGCSSKSEPLKLGKIPWSNYEKSTYEMHQRGNTVGTTDFIIQKTTNATEIFSAAKINTTEVHTNSSVKSDTLMPLSSYYVVTSPQNGRINIKTTYNDKWKIKAITQKGTQNSTVNLPKYYYDNDSLLMILRAYPFKVGDTFKINVAISTTAKVVPINFKVVNTEKVDTPHGSADCYKVEMSVGNQKQYMWYSNDNDRLLYQYDNGQLIYKLKSIEKK